MKHIVLIFALCITGQVFAQNPQDREAIKSMCGCHEVTFAFAETFSPNKDYKFHENYNASGLEWVELVKDDNDKLVLQHLLIVNDTMIVKHWRQDWLYENTELYTYNANNEWQYVKLPAEEVKGQWTQKVYQVDDGPRYEGTATWVHVDGKHFWESTVPSPLPRREFSKRKDYNLMMRTNRHEITDYGWLHEQDNDKIALNESGKTLVAREKGWNTYKKVEDKRCQLAQDWWKENKDFWAVVRTEWDQVYDRDKDLLLHKTVDEKPLFMHMF